jgi:hypothetical protein
MSLRSRVALGMVGAALIASCAASGTEYGDPVDGIACDDGRNVTFQAAIRLSLLEGGRRSNPTMGLGSTGSACNYWVRTEDDDGVIHIRAPHAVQPTLATFFSIWDRAIPPGHGTGGSEPFRNAAEHGQILFNGKPVQGGAAAVPLVNGATIELRVP